MTATDWLGLGMLSAMLLLVWSVVPGLWGWREDWRVYRRMRAMRRPHE